jgi:FtsP/CotA-like multicopper oxidase with cupredoxin domain
VPLTLSFVHRGDNIFIEVPPSGVHHYNYTIGKDHMGGTFWYHPHFHGSTALQTVAGAHGMLIIEDPVASGLPEVYSEMPEIEMVFSEHPIGFLRFWSRNSGCLTSNWTEGQGFTSTNATTTETNLKFVNLQYIPVVQMEENKWYRWRMVQATGYGSAYVRKFSFLCYHSAPFDVLLLCSNLRSIHQKVANSIFLPRMVFI